MLFAFKLEAIGDDVVHERRMCRRHNVPWKPKREIEHSIQAPWVARLLGLDDRYGFQRKFVTGRRDYSEANSSGSRGIWIHYLLEDGIYEVNEPVKWARCRRYCMCVSDGESRELSLKEAVACLT